MGNGFTNTCCCHAHFLLQWTFDFVDQLNNKSWCLTNIDDTLYHKKQCKLVIKSKDYFLEKIFGFYLVTLISSWELHLCSNLLPGSGVIILSFNNFYRVYHWIITYLHVRRVTKAYFRLIWTKMNMPFHISLC